MTGSSARSIEPKGATGLRKYDAPAVKQATKKRGKVPAFPPGLVQDIRMVGRQFIRGRQHNRIDDVYNLGS